VGVCAYFAAEINTASSAGKSARKTKPPMAPTAASKIVNADPMAPDNPPGNHPIAAPITVVVESRSA
jgi:hypothetical protein